MPEIYKEKLKTEYNLNQTILNEISALESVTNTKQTFKAIYDHLKKKSEDRQKKLKNEFGDLYTPRKFPFHYSDFPIWALAAYTNDPAVFKESIEKATGKNKEVTLSILRDEENGTPMHYATEVGNIEMMQYLAEQDSSLKLAEDTAGMTPLVDAAMSGKQEVIEFFQNSIEVQKQPSIDAAIQIVLLANNETAVKFFKENRKNIDPKSLFSYASWVTYKRDLNATKLLLDNFEVDLNFKTDKEVHPKSIQPDMSALMAQYAQPFDAIKDPRVQKIIKLLISKGAFPYKNKKEIKPLPDTYEFGRIRSSRIAYLLDRLSDSNLIQDSPSTIKLYQEAIAHNKDEFYTCLEEKVHGLDSKKGADLLKRAIKTDKKGNPSNPLSRLFHYQRRLSIFHSNEAKTVGKIRQLAEKIQPKAGAAKPPRRRPQPTPSIHGL